MALRDAYFTISEVAKELNVSRQTVYRWITDNKIPTEKIGGVLLVEKYEITQRLGEKIIELANQWGSEWLIKEIRKIYKYGEGVGIQRDDDEDGYMIFIVTDENSNSERIRVGDTEITMLFSRVEKNPQITDIKFKEITRENII